MEDSAEAAFVDQVLEQHDGGHAAVVVPDHVGHVGGFHRIHHGFGFFGVAAQRLFAEHHFAGLAAAMAISAWVSLGLAISMMSMSLRSTSLRQSVSTDS